MSKRTVVAAIFLISIGIVFGAIVVSSFSGVKMSLAGGNEVTFNTTPPYRPSSGVADLNQAFVQVSKMVTPTVVAITVTVKADNSDQQNFFHFFGPDFQAPREERGSGSGIILTPDGYILTNHHVVKGAKENGIQVTLDDGRELKAKLIGSDPSTDVAVIKVNAKDLTPASMGNSDEVQVGEWVLAVGNPLGLNSTVTAGIVSALSRNINIMQDRYGIENFIQTDAAINPGNSGGALVDLNGQVIGMNTAIASTNGRYQGYGFAVPINLAKVVSNAIIKEGKFVRGYIGISIRSVDDKMARGFKLDRTTGVLIDKVNKGSAGEEAGLRDGDIILSVDGREVKFSNQLQSMIGQHRPGETVDLQVFRNEKRIDVKVKLKGLDENAETASNTQEEPDAEAEPDNDGSSAFDKLGFTVKPLDPASKRALHVESGALVTKVETYGQAADANMRPGQVIIEGRVGGKVTKINSVPDLKSFLKQQKTGDSFLLRVVISSSGDMAFIPLEIQE